MRNTVFCILICVFSLGCSEGMTYGEGIQKATNQFQIERKYYLKDCVVKVNFSWNPEDSALKRENVLNAIAEEIKDVLVANVFPLFSGHFGRDGSYYVVYYSDRCDSRIEMTHSLVRDYLSPKIRDLPSYSVDVNVEPGFDGVLPSGWWLDDL